jgi:hypothetical protein
LEEIRFDKQNRRGIVSGAFASDSDFRVKHPGEFATARAVRDRLFSAIDDPIIFLRESPGEPVFVFSPSDTVEDFCDLYGLNAKAKPAKLLFKRLRGYSMAIQELLRQMLRQWPMRVFVRPPKPREYKFTNDLGLAATVWMFLLDTSSTANPSHPN